MSVLLIQPKYGTDPSQDAAMRSICLPNIGLGYLSAVLQANQINSSILDLNVDSPNTLRNHLKKDNIQVIGLTCTTNNSINMIETIKLCRQLSPSSKIVVGGIHATYFYKEIIRKKTADFVIRFEGEFSFLELSKQILSGQHSWREIPNIVYSDGFEICKTKTADPIQDLDLLPFPILNHQKYTDKKIPIFTSRGCAFGCIYCSSSAYWGKKMRYRSIQNIRDEIRFRKERGSTIFTFVDDNLNLNPTRFVELCKMLREEKVQWLANCSLKTIDIEQVKLMKQSGCLSISFGVESADPEVQTKIGKSFDINNAKIVIKKSLELGIKIVCGFILYHYCDTLQTIQTTKNFAQELMDLGATCRFSINTPFRGTYQYDKRKELGITIHDTCTTKYDLNTSTIDTKHFKREDMQSSDEMIYQNINMDFLNEFCIQNNIKSPTHLTPEILQKLMSNPRFYKKKG